MRTRISPGVRATAAGLAIVALGGCASGSGDSGATPVAAQAPATVEGQTGPVELRKGMKPEEVRQALGNPLRIQRVRVPEGRAEKWIYQRGKKTEVRNVATGTKDVPFVDPYTGQLRMIPEPVYSDKATTITEELHLFWHNGELIDWKTEFHSSRSYTQ